MTSIRNFAYATLLALTALNFAPRLASAQEPARGKVHTHARSSLRERQVSGRRLTSSPSIPTPLHAC